MNIVDAAIGPYERVLWAVDPASGLRALVAVHSTALGPAVGGVRLYPYPDEASAVLDALRLAEGMTMKAAVAGLPVGGGKSVILGDPGRGLSLSALRAFARVVERLGGAYYAAEDVGTTLADMEALRTRTPYVLGVGRALGGGGDPSPFTARGVVAAMRAAWEHSTGAASLDGTHVVVQGVGKVGAEVARRAAGDGARVRVADAAPERARRVAAATGGRAVPAAGVLSEPCDILAPCAMGGVLDAATVDALRCRWVVGAANNQLVSDDVAEWLADRDVGYVPDFVANAGGIISVADELGGWDRERVTAGVEGIGETVRELLAEAAAGACTPLAVARARAGERLADERPPRAEGLWAGRPPSSATR